MLFSGVIGVESWGDEAESKVFMKTASKIYQHFLWVKKEDTHCFMGSFNL